MTASSDKGMTRAGGVAVPGTAASSSSRGLIATLARAFALSVAAGGLIYVVNAYLVFWRGWPGLRGLFGHLGWFGMELSGPGLEGGAVLLGWIELLVFLGPIAGIAAWTFLNRGRSLHADSELLSDLAAFVARGAFWAVVLVGLADAAISFLRVEDLLSGIVGAQLTQDLGRANFRGDYVHFPLIALGFAIALVTRSVGFVWLALLVVAAEFQIVILRFIFSYEQAFMADLVRFWYAGLFLFASAYTLLHEGHVRVDILYTTLSTRAKAWSNAVGSLILGTPVCWVILTRGMSEKGNVINSPLLNYEVTQAGFGMYVKYLMAGFLAIYALIMLFQFMSALLNSVAILLREPGAHVAPTEEAHF